VRPRRREIPETVIEQLIQHNALQAGQAPAGHGWNPYVRRSLHSGLEGYCDHGSLKAYSNATRALLVRIRRRGEDIEGVVLEEHDAVHLDFHHRNVLVEGGQLTAVIDCEGLRNGDRVFDLVTLAFCLIVANRSLTAERMVWQTIRRLRPEPVVDAYLAHQALRQVDWSIRHRDEREVARWLARSTELLA
jgi:hypothetical protein